MRQLLFGERVQVIRGVFKGQTGTVQDHRLRVLVKTDDGWCAWISPTSIAPTQHKESPDV